MSDPASPVFGHNPAGTSGDDALNDKVFSSLLAWVDLQAGRDAMVQWKDGAPASRFFRDVANSHLVLRGSGQGRGIRATRTTQDAPSRVLAAIPPNALMTVTSARDKRRSDPLASLLKAEPKKSKKGKGKGAAEPAAPISNHTIVVAHVMCELSKLEASFWWPYLATFPARRDARVGALWWDDAVLVGSPSLFEHVQSLRARESASRAEARALFGRGKGRMRVVDKGCGGGQDTGGGGGGWWGGASFDEAFDDAAALVLSRSASLPHARGGDDPASDGDWGSAEVMTPLLDLLNHRSGAGRYMLLAASGGSDLGFGILAPPDGELAAGDEVFHDYEGGAAAAAAGEGAGNMGAGNEFGDVGCAHEFLAAYGFLPDGDGGGDGEDSDDARACALLPWVGVVRLRDVAAGSGSKLLELCRGNVPIKPRIEAASPADVSAEGPPTTLAEALRWEIDHDLKVLEALLEADPAGPDGEGPDGKGPDGGACRAAGTCDDSTVASFTSAADGDEGALLSVRALLARRVAVGEMKVLRALQAACSPPLEAQA